MIANGYAHIIENLGPILLIVAIPFPSPFCH